MMLNRDSLRAFLSRGFKYLLGGGISRGLPFLTAPILTRVFSAEEYGLFGLALAATSFFVGLVSLGAPQYLIASYDKLRAVGDTASGLVAAGGLSLVGSVVSAVLLLVLDAFGWLGSFSQLLWIALALATARVVLLLLSTVFQMEDRASDFLMLTLVPATSVLVFSVLASEWDWIGWHSLLVIEMLAITVVVGLWRRDAKRLIAGDVRARFGDVARFAVPVAPHILALWGLNLADRLVIESVMGTSAVGMYTAAYSVGMGLSLLLESAQRVWQPAFYRSLNTLSWPHRTRVPTMMLQGAMATLLLGAVYGAVAYLGFPWLVGGDFGQSRSVVLIVSLGYGVHGIYRILASIPLYHGITGRLGFVSVAAFIVNLILNVIFVPRYGLDGAAWATVAAFGAQAFGALVIGWGRFAAPAHLGLRE